MRGIGVDLVGNAHLVEKRLGFGDTVAAMAALNVDRRFDEVLLDRHMRPKIEALEHHGDTGADAVDLLLVGNSGAVARRLQANGLAVNRNFAGSRQFEHVDATQHRALA